MAEASSSTISSSTSGSSTSGSSTPGLAARGRPLSPHLQIWRWGPAMAVSILHRATGSMLVVGLLLLLCWLGALAGGSLTYEMFTHWVWAPLAGLEWGGLRHIVGSLIKLALKLLLIAVSWAYFNHLCSGLRHFVMDIGGGFELKGNTTVAMLTPVIGIVLTAAFWAVLLA